MLRYLLVAVLSCLVSTSLCNINVVLLDNEDSDPIRLASVLQIRFQNGEFPEALGFEVSAFSISGMVSSSNGYQQTLKVSTQETSMSNKMSQGNRDFAHFLRSSLVALTNDEEAFYEQIELNLATDASFLIEEVQESLSKLTGAPSSAFIVSQENVHRARSCSDDTTGSVTSGVATTGKLTTGKLTTARMTTAAATSGARPLTSGSATTNAAPAPAPAPAPTPAPSSPTPTPTPAPASGCGNGICSNGETCGTCARDCGLCRTYTCSPDTCRPPNCKCADRNIPGGVPQAQTPQFISLTWDDAIDDSMIRDYMDLTLNTPGRDAAGCSLRQTFYITTDNTRWTNVQALRAHGNEIGIHTITHDNSLQDQPYSRLYSEYEYGHQYIADLSQTPRDQVIGARAPFLRYSPDMFDVINNYGMLYDSSMADQPSNGDATIGNLLWPYTLDQGTPQSCRTLDQGICPNKSLPGMWEVPMNTLAHAGNTFDLMDPQGSSDYLLQELKANFLYHYNGNRSPFGVFLHYTWVQPGRIQLLKDFFTWAVTNRPDVYFANPAQMIAWTKNPVPSSQVPSMPEFACQVLVQPSATVEICDGLDNDLDGQIDEGVGNTCTYSFGTFKTCAPCPRTYPNLNGPEPVVAGWAGTGLIDIQQNGNSFCATVKFTNPSVTNSLSWTVSYKITGGTVPGSPWSCESVKVGNLVTLTPYTWNNVVARGATYDGIGFCGNGIFAYSDFSVQFI